MSQCAHRKGQYKKGLSASDGRRRRQEATLRLRKDKRAESLAKRRNLSSIDEKPSKPVTVEVRSFQEAVDAIRSGLPEAMFAGCVKIRKDLSRETEPPTDNVIQSGILTELVQLLLHPNPKIQLEAAWAVTNVASTDFTYAVVDAKAVPPLVKLLHSSDPEVREQACWCLGNIAGDRAEYREMLMKCGALPGIVLNAEKPHSISLLRNVTWTISNFCRTKPTIPPIEYIREVIGIVIQLSQHADKEVAADASWALSYITDSTTEHIEAAIKAGACRVIVDLLRTRADISIITPTLRCLGNIVGGTDSQTQEVINCGAIQAFMRLLRFQQRNIRKEACWSLSNIAAGSVAQIQAILDVPGIVDVVLSLIATDSFSIQKEATFVITNALTGGSPDQVRRIAGSFVMEPLCAMLDQDDLGLQEGIIAALDTLLVLGETEAENPFKRQLEELGGMDKLEDLQRRGSDEIYDLVADLMQRHFELDDEENSGPNAQVTEEGQRVFQFAAPETAPAQPFDFSSGFAF